MRCRRCHALLGHGHVAIAADAVVHVHAAPAPPAAMPPHPRGDALTLDALATSLDADPVPAAPAEAMLHDHGHGDVPSPVPDLAPSTYANAGEQKLQSVRFDRQTVSEAAGPGSPPLVLPLESATAADWLRRWRERGRGRFMVFGRDMAPGGPAAARAHYSFCLAAWILGSGESWVLSTAVPAFPEPLHAACTTASTAASSSPDLRLVRGTVA